MRRIERLPPRYFLESYEVIPETILNVTYDPLGSTSGTFCSIPRNEAQYVGTSKITPIVNFGQTSATEATIVQVHPSPGKTYCGHEIIGPHNLIALKVGEKHRVVT